MASILRKLGLRTAELFVEKVLSHSESGVYEIKSIIINGNNKNITFIIHFIKPSSNVTRLIQFIKEKIGFENNIPFPSKYKIYVLDEFLQDCTSEVVELQEEEILINLNKIIRLKSKRYIIQARGPYQYKIKNFFDYSYRNHPTLEDDIFKQYSVKIVFYRSMFITEELQLLDIPLKVNIPIYFLNKVIFTQRMLRLKKAIEANLDFRKKYHKYKEMFEGYLNISYEKLWNYIGLFMLKFQDRVKNRFKEFFILECNASAYMSTASLSHKKAYPEFPEMSIELTILVDYRDEKDKIIDLHVQLDKQKLESIASKVWRKIRERKLN